MAEFLADEWIAGVVEGGGALPHQAGLDVVIQFDVAGTPTGKVRWYAAIRDGQISEAASGRAEDPDCTVQFGYDDGRAVFLGELNPAVGYMQGRLKIDGAYALVVFGLERLVSTPEWAAFVSGLREQTH